MSKLTKQQRLDFVATCIKTHKICNQKQLAERLQEQGLILPQATLSRYLNLLGVKKKSVEEGGSYFLPRHEDSRESETLWQHVRGTILQIQEAANLVVIKTLPAAAQAVGAALDEMHLPEIVGTLAGDDAIFVATPGDEAAQILADKLLNLIKEMRS